jgi:alkylation response protein AidB-like acyl-CoA dehydrogenase
MTCWNDRTARSPQAASWPASAAFNRGLASVERRRILAAIPGARLADLPNRSRGVASIFVSDVDKATIQPCHTSEARDFRTLVRSAVKPFAARFDDWEHDGHVPRSFFEALGDSGVFRQRWQLGPARGHALSRILTEELAPLNGGVALAVSIHSEVFTHALIRFGTGHDGLIEDALAGRAIGCFASTEASGGSDLSAMRTIAYKSGSSWRLRGEKRFTTNVGSSTHIMVLTNGMPGSQGPSLFCLPLSRPGIRVVGFYDTLGVRSADTAALSLDTSAESADIVGKPGAGLHMVLHLLDFERLAAAAGLLSGAETALRLARAWGRRRTQFSVRLLDHQVLRHRLADRWVDVYAARAALDATCRLLTDRRTPHVEIAAMKLIATRAASLAIDEALQIFGARGYTSVYPLERMYRDTRLTRIGGGTDEMMRGIVAAYLDTEDAEAGDWLDALEQRDFVSEPPADSLDGGAALLPERPR